MKLNILLMCALTFAACVPSANFESPNYVAASQPLGKTLPLRVAVAYPEEGLNAPDRDQDIQPIISARCAQGHTYISPRLDISRGLIDELRALNAFKVTHWAPESLDDYDLIVRLKITSGGERFKSDTCPMLLGPFQWELAVMDQQGKEFERVQLPQAKINLYARGVVQQYRKDEQVFLGHALKPIMVAAEKIAAATQDIKTARSLSFVDKRDPTLKVTREKLAASPGDQQLERNYLLRLAVLESARIVEEQATEAHQTLDDKAWIDLQEQSRQELKAYGEDVKQMIRNSYLMLLGNIANAGLQVGTVHGRPAALLQAQADARGGLVTRLDAPGGVEGLLNGLPKGLLPGKSANLISDVNFGVELASKLRKVLSAPDQDAAVAGSAEGQGASSGGCAKDTDCKGDRICVDGICKSPAAQ